MLGLVELVEIDYIHRKAEFQIIIDLRIKVMVTPWLPQI